MSQATQLRPNSRLLIVEDDPSQLRTIVDIMLDAGFEATGCRSAAEAVERVEREDFGVAVVDLNLGDLSGTELLERIRSIKRNMSVIIHTGYASFDSAKSALNLGAFAYVEKLGDPSELVGHVNRALRERLDHYAENLEAAVEQRTLQLQEKNAQLQSEIRDRKQAEQELWLSVEVTENMSEGVVLVRASDGILVFTNPRYEKMFGYDPGELLGKHCTILNAKNENSPDGTAAEIIGQLEKDGLWTGEVHNARKDKTTFWTHSSISTFKHPEHGTVWVAVVEDITERKRAGEALRASEARFRKYFELGLVGIAITSPEKGWIEVNDRLCEICGYTRSELMQKTWPELMHPDDLAKDDKQFERVLAGEIDGYAIEKRLIQQDGNVIHGSVHINCLRLADGSVDYFVAVVQDITGRKQAEAELRESEICFQQIVNAVDDVVWITDWHDQSVIFTSPAYEKIWGRSVQDLYEHPKVWAEAIHPDDRQRVWEAFLQLGENELLDEEFRITRPDGCERWIRDRRYPVRDTNGQVYRVVGLAQDVTERKLAEEATRKHRDEMAHVSRISTMGEMATGLAHELNQPLAAISTYSHVAKSMVDRLQLSTGKLQDILGNLEDQAIRAGDIVRRLRRFLRKTDSVCVSTDLNLLIRNVVKFIDPDIRQAEVVMDLKFDRPTLQVRVDEIQIQQVLVNLIRNAIDAMNETPIGKRTLTVSNRIREDGRVELAVQDAGKGLPPEELEQAFNAFFTTKQEGMGMGLAISRSIIEAHDGKLWGRPNTGPGVTFGFTLPYQTEIFPETIDKDLVPTVFVVDDEDVVRGSLCLAVEDMGLTVNSFSSAVEFLAFFESYRISGQVCLITDIQMPVISGIEMLEHLRKLGKELPVIIVTGHGDRSLKQRAEELGAAIFIEKPFRTAQLEDAITTIFNRNTGETKAA